MTGPRRAGPQFAIVSEALFLPDINTTAAAHRISDVAVVCYVRSPIVTDPHSETEQSRRPDPSTPEHAVVVARLEKRYAQSQSRDARFYESIQF